MPTRRNTNRILQHDYSTPGQYFITIRAENREQLFGIIENDKMILNDAGKIVDFSWRGIINHFTGIELDQYIIMPNHIHGIINIVGAGFPRPKSPRMDNNINDKYQSTKQINGFQNVPGRKIWQRDYYGHVIRNDKSLNRIREYIINNPATWNNDIENPNNIDSIELNKNYITKQSSWPFLTAKNAQEKSAKSANFLVMRKLKIWYN